MSLITLTSTKLSNTSLDFIGDVQVIRSRNFIGQIMDSALGSGTSQLLSIPQLSQDNENIDWQTDLIGPVRHISTLSYPEKVEVYRHLAVQAKNFSDLGKMLSPSPERQKQVAAQVFTRLSQAMGAYLVGAPSTLDIFLVGDHVSMVNWGLKSLIPEDAALTPEELRAREQVNELLHTGAVPLESLQRLQIIPAALADRDDSKDEGAWKLLRVFLTAILTFVILSLLLLLLFPGLYKLMFSAKSVDVKLDFRKERNLQDRLFSLKEELIEKTLNCETLEPQARLDLPKKELEAQGAEVEDSERVISVPKGEPEEGDSFDIPEGDPNDLSFLKGCWKSDAGLFNTRTGLPLFAIYCLDDQGAGTSTFELYDKKGKHLDTCVGKATAKRNGDSVTIVNDGPKCQKNGSRFSVDTLSCSSGENNRTSCKVENTHSRQNPRKPYYDSKFTYLRAN
ncbi:MAG: hypothetical protein LBE27_05185 [Deltaproteobacteria bacterium]|jgi:hypothetical protein|nr:hypothetical protein [Deltaproteobacteria bacterium]